MPALTRYRSSRRLWRHSPMSGMGLIRGAFNAGRLVRRFYNAYRNSGGGGMYKRTNATESRGTRQPVDVSQYHEDKTVYRRRRAPRRIRYKARNFSRRVQHVVNNQLGQRSIMRRQTGGIANATTPTYLTGQGVRDFTMYTAFPGLDANNDLLYIAGTIEAATGVASRIDFKSCVMDFKLRNVGPNDQPSPACYVDIYYISCRQAGIESPVVTWNTGMADQNQLPNVTDVPTPGTIGITPFDSPYFGQFWTIYRKRRVYLAPNGNYSFQLRNARNMHYGTNESGNVSSYSRMSNGVIITVTPEAQDYSAGVQHVNIMYEVTRTYHYCVLENDTDYRGAITQLV
nr:Cap [Kummerowia striata CRESS virus]